MKKTAAKKKAPKKEKKVVAPPPPVRVEEPKPSRIDISMDANRHMITCNSISHFNLNDNTDLLGIIKQTITDPIANQKQADLTLAQGPYRMYLTVSIVREQQ